MKFFIEALSENNVPSSTRLFILVLVVFTVSMLSADFVAHNKLPDVPESLSDLLKFLFTLFVLKAGLSQSTDLVGALALLLKGRNNAGQS